MHANEIGKRLCDAFLLYKNDKGIRFDNDADDILKDKIKKNIEIELNGKDISIYLFGKENTNNYLIEIYSIYLCENIKSKLEDIGLKYYYSQSTDENALCLMNDIKDAVHKYEAFIRMTIEEELKVAIMYCYIC